MMSFASPVTDLWTPRRRSFWVRSPNQRSALCRYQHKIDYADTVIMPNSWSASRVRAVQARSSVLTEPA